MVGSVVVRLSFGLKNPRGLYKPIGMSGGGKKDTHGV